MGTKFGCEITFNDTILLVTPIVSICIAWCGFSERQQRVKMEILSRYNKVFTSDEIIQKVVAFLQQYDSIDIPDNMTDRPDGHEFHMFARFFEELFSSMKNCKLNDEYICRLFAYYAIEASDKNLIGSREDKSWCLFFTFVDEMKLIEKRLGIVHKRYTEHNR